jgi:hypothetical protein
VDASGRRFNYCDACGFREIASGEQPQYQEYDCDHEDGFREEVVRGELFLFCDACGFKKSGGPAPSKPGKPVAKKSEEQVNASILMLQQIQRAESACDKVEESRKNPGQQGLAPVDVGQAEPVPKPAEASSTTSISTEATAEPAAKPADTSSKSDVVLPNSTLEPPSKSPAMTTSTEAEENSEKGSGYFGGWFS